MDSLCALIICGNGECAIHAALAHRRSCVKMRFRSCALVSGWSSQCWSFFRMPSGCTAANLCSCSSSLSLRNPSSFRDGATARSEEAVSKSTNMMAFVVSRTTLVTVFESNIVLHHDLRIITAIAIQMNKWRTA